VPIVSRSEFEAVLNQACIKIDKTLDQRGQVPTLEDARRTLVALQQAAKDSEKLKAMRSKLESASDVISSEMASDTKLRDDMWDCLDYIDYRA
jgi:hypothetical protein